MDVERRKAPRSRGFTEVHYESLGVQAQGRISDISEDGFFIDTINPLPEGSVLLFRFSLPGDDSENPISGESRVVWQRPMEGMGVHIVHLSDFDRARLRSFLRRR